MISFRQKGDFSKTTRFLKNTKNVVRNVDLDKYGREGVAALRSATPIDSGDTANCWYYKVEKDASHISIAFYNDNNNKGVPIAIIIQYGHGTGTGGWVEGRDYINPAIQPIFDKLSSDLWREVTKS